MSRCCIPLVAVVSMLATLLFPGIVHSFHEGGEKYCQGCHIIHGSASAPDPGTNENSIATPPEVRLIGSDPSSTCLRCHAVKSEACIVLSDDGSWFTPGGDFYWLRKTFGWHDGGRYMQSEADRHGHNIVAVDYDLSQDRNRSTSPGGSYPAADLGCDSCHDPHGKTNNNAAVTGAPSVSGPYGDEPGGVTGTYRLLAGAGYRRGRRGSGHTFTYGAPIAVASSTSWVESDANHTAYGSDLSQWCGNCHVDFLGSHAIEGRKNHPVGKDALLSAEIAGNYNAYVRSGDFRGTQASAYLSLVPFETGITNTLVLNPYSSAGPDRSANVMCLTCHRAHASAFENIGRWDFRARLIADAHPRGGDAGVTGNDVLNSFY
ncbi:MAG: cytochrome C, partial [Pseudomonadota bacterium]